MKAGAGNNTLLIKLRSRFDSLLGEVCDYQKGGGRLLRIYTLKFSLFLVALHLFSFIAPAQVYTDTLSIYFPYLYITVHFFSNRMFIFFPLLAIRMFIFFPLSYFFQSHVHFFSIRDRHF